MSISVALVWHTEIEGVWPDGDAAERSRNRSIIDEELVRHHFKLLVAAYAKIRSTHTNDRSVGNIGKSFSNQTSSGHLREPVIVGAVGPVIGIILVRQGEYGDLVAFAVQVLNGGIVAVFVRDEERTLDGAAVGILALTIENIFVQINVVYVNRTVERNGNHLRYLLWFDVSRNTGSVR